MHASDNEIRQHDILLLLSASSSKVKKRLILQVLQVTVGYAIGNDHALFSSVLFGLFQGIELITSRRHNHHK